MGDDLPLGPCARRYKFRVGACRRLRHLFLDDPSDQEVKEQFNASVASEDLRALRQPIADFAEKMTTYAGSAADPGAIDRKNVMRRLLGQCVDVGAIASDRARSEV